MRYLKYIVLLGWLVAWLPLQAAQLKDLYEAEVEVADQSRALRMTAMGEAMASVLLKVSGSSHLLEEEVLKSAMADPARYVRQYRYRSEPIPLEEQQPTETGEPPATSRLMLWVGFDNSSIDNLLRRYGFPVWSAARPATLVWLAVEEGKRRVLVGANDRGRVREVLDKEAERRAIPLRFPLLDLTDQSAVRPIDVWGGFIDNIEAASLRYEPQAVLVGKLYATGSEWEVQWTLRYQGEQHQWRHRAEDVDAVIASGVGGSSDYLSARFAESSHFGTDQLALRIEAVDGMNDFRRVNDYLLSLHGVDAVVLRRVDATSSSFIVHIEGAQETVLQAIERGDVLVKVEQPLEPELPVYSPEPQRAPAPAGESPTGNIAVNGPAANEMPPEASQQGVEHAVTEEEKLMEETEQLLEQPETVPVQELVYRLLS